MFNLPIKKQFQIIIINNKLIKEKININKKNIVICIIIIKKIINIHQIHIKKYKKMILIFQIFYKYHIIEKINFQSLISSSSLNYST